MSDPTDDAPPQPLSEDGDDPAFEAALRAVARPPSPGHLARALSTVDVPGARELMSVAFQDALEDAREPSPGTVIDERYRVQEVLGRGGMGVVLAAEQLHTGKSVAIKWISARGGARHDAAGRARLRREARTVAKVSHPHVVAIYDAGEWEGTPYLVMERLVGESLRTRLERGTLSWDEARHVLAGVLAGVAAAHAVGVVHRDLKPDNIFLCQASGEARPHPKVLDFGIAAVRAQSAEQLESLTRTGALVGTPAYMAPEQLLGRAVDERTDVYALGVVLFEMLTGKLPFEEAHSAAELAVLQATRTPPRLGELDPRLRGVPERCVARALAREPAQRYASSHAFAHELVAAREPPWRAWVAAGAMLCLAGGAAWALQRADGAIPGAAHEAPAGSAVGRAAQPVSFGPAVTTPVALPNVSDAGTPQVATEPTDSGRPDEPPRTGARRLWPSLRRSVSVTATPAPTPPPPPDRRTAIRVDDF